MKVLYSSSLDVNSGAPAMSTYNTLYVLQAGGKCSNYHAPIIS